MFKVLVYEIGLKKQREKPKGKIGACISENIYFGSENLKKISRYPILDISLASI